MAHVAGKIALLHPPISSPITGDVENGFTMQMDGATAKAIASAGAAGILVAPPADGIAEIWYHQADLPSIPTALLSSQEAAQLTSLLTAGRSSVTVTTAWPSPYTYDLDFTQPGGLTNGMTLRVKDEDLARVTTRYHSTAPGQYDNVYTATPGPSFTEDIPSRTVRTEMYTPGAGFFQARSPEISNWQPLWEVASISLAAGHYEMNVGSGPWVPSASLASQQSDLYLASGTATGSSGGYLEGGYVTDTTTIVCQPPACQQTPNGDKLSGDGTYQVINDQSSTPSVTGNPLSVKTHTEWTINVHLNTQSNAPVTQPMIQTTWYVDGGLDNVVPTGTPYTVRVVPSYPGGTGSHGLVTARLWATYDDGQTWVQVPGTRVMRPGQPATFRLRTPAQTNGFVGYRVQMSDADGNAINQTVIQAAFTQPPA
jgi:hypothetical protein